MDIKLQPPQKFMLTDKRFVYYLGPFDFILEYEKMNKCIERLLDLPKKTKTSKGFSGKKNRLQIL